MDASKAMRIILLGMSCSGENSGVVRLQRCGPYHTLAKGAYTANAARRISGDTLHALGGMTTRIHNIPKGERLRGIFGRQENLGN
jgi:hypothetical protein